MVFALISISGILLSATICLVQLLPIVSFAALSDYNVRAQLCTLVSILPFQLNLISSSLFATLGLLPMGVTHYDCL